MPFWRRRPDPDRIHQVPLDRILSNPHQPRRRVDPAGLAALARSIQENGVLVPILIRPLSGGKKFELVAGQRRLAACRQLKLATIPAMVREMSEEEIVRLGLLENLHRSNLSEVEEAGALRSLAADFEGVTPVEAARRVGLDPAGAERRMRLLDLPMLVQEAMVAGLITPAHAEAMRGIRDPARQAEILKRIRAEGLTADQVLERAGSAGVPPLSVAGAPSPRIAVPAPPVPAAASVSAPSGLDAVARAAEAVLAAASRGEAGAAREIERLAGEILREVRRDPVAALAWNPPGPGGAHPAPHAVRTAAHVLFMAARSGIADREAAILGSASLASDAGMIRIPPELTGKRGALSDAERDIVRRHVSGIRDALLASGLDRRAVRIVEQHHERFDGTGYPASARGPAIDPLALWVGVMDMYTAMGESRAWRPPLAPRKAVQQVLLAGHRGIFPKHLLRDFIHALGLFPVGSRVRLKSGRRGVVAEANPESVAKPVVVLENGERLDLAADGDEILSEV